MSQAGGGDIGAVAWSMDVCPWSETFRVQKQSGDEQSSSEFVWTFYLNPNWYDAPLPPLVTDSDGIAAVKVVLKARWDVQLSDVSSNENPHGFINVKARRFEKHLENIFVAFLNHAGMNNGSLKWPSEIELPGCPLEAAPNAIRARLQTSDISSELWQHVPNLMSWSPPIFSSVAFYDEADRESLLAIYEPYSPDPTQIHQVQNNGWRSTRRVLKLVNSDGGEGSDDAFDFMESDGDFDSGGDENALASFSPMGTGQAARQLERRKNTVVDLTRPKAFSSTRAKKERL